MDRRTLLAFGLIFAVLVMWPKLYGLMYPNAGDPGAADSTVVESVLPTATAAVIDDAPAERSQPVEEESRTATEPDAGTDEMTSPTTAAAALTFAATTDLGNTVVVETELYRAEIDARGATIVQWSGKQYPDRNGEGAVELVPELEGPPAADVIVFDRDELDLGDAVFAIDGPSHLDLSGTEYSRDLVLRAETMGGITVTKTFTFHPDSYEIGVATGVDVDVSAQQWVGDARAVRYVWGAGIASTERLPKFEERNFRSFARVGDELVFTRRNDLRKSEEKVTRELQGSIIFAGVQNKYFHIAGVVSGAREGRVTEGRLGIGGDKESDAQSWWIETPLRREVGDETFAGGIDLYIGPSLSGSLEVMGVDLERTMELGFKIFRPLAVLLLSIMHWMQHWISNYGLIIVIISVLTRVIFYPLTQSSTKSMRKMAELQPKLKAIQEKYKDNKEKVSKETMKLYKEEKVNPMGGCLPLLVQSPIFIALYQVLANDIALRQQPFVLWIKDLAQPDALYTLPFSLPHFGADFNLLPFLMAGAMYYQTKLTPTTGGAGGQMAMMNNLMPIMMLVFFYNMPSGLVMYWTINTLVQLYQSWRIKATTPASEGAR